MNLEPSKEKPENIISIDPGYNHTGVCIYCNGKIVELTTLNLPKTEPDKYGILKQHLTILCEKYKINLCLIEGRPAFTRGKLNITSLDKLDFVRRAIIHILTTYTDLKISILEIPSTTWKANLPKYPLRVFNALYPELKNKRTSQHSRDAAFMLAWYLKQTNFEKFFQKNKNFS